MKHHTQPDNPTSFDMALIETIAPPVRIFVAAILAAGTTNPTPEEVVLIKVLGLDQVQFHHVAFAGFLRRVAAGQSPDSLAPYLEPADSLGMLPDAWEAVAWMRSVATTTQAINRSMVH